MVISSKLSIKWGKKGKKKRKKGCVYYVVSEFFE